MVNCTVFFNEAAFILEIHVYQPTSECTGVLYGSTPDLSSSDDLKIMLPCWSPGLMFVLKLLPLTANLFNKGKDLLL